MLPSRPESLSEKTIQNFSVLSSSMGTIVLQPVTLDAVQIEQASLVVYPHSISKESFNVGVEWASGTQTPIFCTEQDVERFESEGFGSYRFHKLDGYHEVDFQGGALEFFPAKKKPLKGVKGVTQEVSNWLGIQKKSPGYHVLIRPKGEHPVLFLASAYVESSEWEVLMRARPQTIVGSSLYTQSEWHAFSTAVKRRVQPVQFLEQIKTAVRGPGQEEIIKRENPMWAVRSGSL